MEPELSQRIAQLETKVDEMYSSVEKIRKYFLWTGIITVALFILPLIGLAFVIPTFLNSYAQIGNYDQTSGQSTNQLDSVTSLFK